MAPLAAFLVSLGVRGVAALLAFNVVGAIAAGWWVLGRSGSGWSGWGAAAGCFAVLQATLAAAWVPLVVAVTADRSIRRDGLARHVLDEVLRLLAVGWPEARTLATGREVPAEFVERLRTASHAFADEQSGRSPRVVRPVVRFILRRLAGAAAAYFLSAASARRREDGSMVLLEVPRLIGDPLDRALLRRLWIPALAVSAAGVVASVGTARVCGALAGGSSPPAGAAQPE